MTQRKIRQTQHRNTKKQFRAFAEVMESRYLLSGSVTPEIVTHAPIIQIGDAAPTPETLVTVPNAPISVPKMRGAYGLGQYNSSSVTFNGVQGDGTGQTIAIYEDGDEPTIKTDLTAFDTYWKLSDPPSFRVMDEYGGNNLLGPGDESETALDVEWAHAMAPGASLVILEGGSISTAITTAMNLPAIAATSTTPYVGPVSVITISYTSTSVFSESDFTTPSGRVSGGVSTMSSAGDTGGEVKYPANDYEDIAVGGSDLYTSGNAYSSEVAWSSGGGGITPVTQPGYQKNTVSAFSTTYRTTPDVAMDADPSTGVAIYDAYVNGTSTPWNEDEGGTSLSSPLFAGVLAVADQGRVAAGLTTLDGYTQTLPRIYNLAANNFHDITTGNNGNAAGVGYDLATGRGSVVGNKFIPDIAGGDTITGRVFVDVNGNGVYDAGVDTVMANKTVYFDLDNDGVQDSTEPTAITNSSGIYTFSDQIGGITAPIRLASLPAGELHSTTSATVTTAYATSQTANIGFYVTNYVAAANPNVVTGTTSALSVTGTGPTSDASTFLFTWSATTAPTGATPTFTANGTNAAQSNTVTFNKAGSYVFTVVISDQQGSTVTSTVNITVNQTLTAVTLAPISISLGDGLTNQFTATATDQFNNAMSTQLTLTWSIDSGGVGSITSTGLYTAPAAGPGSATVRVTTGTFTATAAVTVIFNTINGTSGDDVIRLLRSGSSLLVYENNTSSPVYNVLYSSVGALTINTGAGNDTVNVDFSGGASPVPTAGLSYNGSSNTTADTLIITGTTAADTATINAATITFNNAVVNYSNIEAITINGNGGADSLTQTAQPGNAAALVFNGTTTGGPSSTDTFNISAGTYAFATPTTGAGILPLSLASLTVGVNASVTVPNAAAHSDRWVLALGSLSVSGKLDLGGNDMLVHNGSSGSIFSALQTGFAGGAWNGQGIASTVAQVDPTHLTALGMAPGLTGGTFDKITTASTDVLVKFTYYGDATVDGAVDGSDYSKIDFGNFGTVTGWSNGDFNYDGSVNGSDYTLIDNAFNSQGASLAASVATPAAQTARLVTKTTFSNLPLFAAKSAAITPTFVPSISAEAAISNANQDVIDKLSAVK